jgi:hypothetical protein
VKSLGSTSGETILGIELVAGEAAQDIEDGDRESLAIVDDEDGMGPVLLLVGTQVSLHGVEEVGGVRAHGEAELAGERAEKAGGGGGQIFKVDDADAGPVELADEAAQSDALADARGAGDERQSAQLAPQEHAVEELALAL